MTHPMMNKAMDAEEERDFREWAHGNYVPFSEINPCWHVTLRDECCKINSSIIKTELFQWRAYHDIPEPEGKHVS